MVGARRRRRGAQSAARPRRNARLANNDSFAAMRLARNQTSDLPTDSLPRNRQSRRVVVPCRRRTPWTRGSCPRLSTATPTPGLSPTPTLTSTARRSRRMHPRAASGGARAWRASHEVATCVSRKHRREALGATARLPPKRRRPPSARPSRARTRASNRARRTTRSPCGRTKARRYRPRATNPTSSPRVSFARSGPAGVLDAKPPRRHRPRSASRTIRTKTSASVVSSASASTPRANPVATTPTRPAGSTVSRVTA